ncbi:HEPN-associated N-terminal domain-containing protein [Acrocarpospora sp. B8E8]|uniref:HEPN-associated N-terminal domain-containing protein n=1 Tax=Acrocarpospora sp. B8E8 TaxID=3153572 RepID=UPI00325E85FA
MGLAKKWMMELEERGFGDTGDHAVCLTCVLSDDLRKQLSEMVSVPKCSFCGEESPSVDLEDLLPLVMDAIRFFYERSEESLFWSDDVTRRSSTWEVVTDVCSGMLSDGVVEVITEIIPEDDWNEDPGQMRPDRALSLAWEIFKEKVKHETRFVFLALPEEPSDHPDDFTTTELLETLVKIIKRQNTIVELPAGHVFFRGRLIDNPDQVEQYNAENLGSPPPRKASANRMSPAGISMFYGSDDAETVVAEIGAHSASRFAVIAGFEAVRPLRMVDLAGLPEVPNYFSPQGREQFFDVMFLRAFAADLREPVSFNGGEHIEYVPTQVVTEYLRWLPQLALDGVLFTSPHNGGRSCVLFCGPDACADSGEETEETVLRLRKGLVRVLRVVSVPADL